MGPGGSPPDALFRGRRSAVVVKYAKICDTANPVCSQSDRRRVRDHHAGTREMMVRVSNRKSVDRMGGGTTRVSGARVRRFDSA